ncbi:ComF family protein [Thermodesulfovibrionales bacterium]|nr:ComF family protein [Thermodesulfovibrionales bacterium]
MICYDNLLNLFFPSRCPICESKSDRFIHSPICAACWKGIEKYSGNACNICGIPTISLYTTICESCLRAKPSFTTILYYGIYEGTLRKAIHLLKFTGIKRLARPLSGLLCDLAIPEADGIVPVPLHKKRLRQREFNQTAVIGRHLSRELKIPLMLNILKKIKDTLPQTEVNREERLKNVKSTYTASEKIKEMDLLLVDDVVTTGATARECASALLTAGAKSVTVIALARSQSKSLV